MRQVMDQEDTGKIKWQQPKLYDMNAQYAMGQPCANGTSASYGCGDGNSPQIACEIGSGDG